MGGKVRNVDIKWGEDFQGLVQWAKGEEVDLLVPGPEQPLVDGVEGVFRRGALETDMGGLPSTHAHTNKQPFSFFPFMPTPRPHPFSQPASPYSVHPPKPPA